MYKDQTSDLIFEKVLNKDRSISRDPVVAFVEQNGNFYYQPPLMSLARRYHKTDDYGHSQLLKQFTDVLQNYSIDESDTLLTILNTESDNPRLLIILKNKIDGFTSKSPATTTGKLYSQMASNIVLADTLIGKQEMVTKRQFTNSKIQDFRNVLLPNLQKKESYGTRYGRGIVNAGAYLPKPLISRNLIAIYSVDSELLLDLDPTPSDVSKYFKLETSAYYFFDYEKALNYRSEISKFLNPYNVEQIFGKGSLASYFKFDTCTAKKIPPLLRRQKTYVLRHSNNSIIQIDQDPDLNFHSLEGSVGKTQSFTAAGMDLLTLKFSPDDNQKLYSTLMQRGFDTVVGLDDYRLSLFELKDYQKSSATDGLITDGLKSIRLTFDVSIKDSTMKFYDVHVRQKIFALLEGIEKYFNHASDFCSYNNIDGRFNDFFLENIRDQFSEPYPWVEAPFYYYAFSKMIGASLDASGDRRRDGILLDLESIRQAAIDKKDFISPEAGNLESLQSFYKDLQKLVREYFTKNSGLDESNEIYLNTGEAPVGYYLVNPEIDLNFEREDDFDQSMITSDFPVKEIEDRTFENSIAEMTCEELTEEAQQVITELVEGRISSDEANTLFILIGAAKEEKGC
tara:strand:- start:2494 stop:4365 length:1872 start_codon:yes stop_codon:yes gene_type:complete